jgi:hypothetical protein
MIPAAIISFTLAAIIAVLMVLGLDYMEKITLIMMGRIYLMRSKPYLLIWKKKLK